MILVDGSVWVDHLRTGNQALINRLDAGCVLAHSFVIGALVLGHRHRRVEILAAQADLPLTSLATDAEVLAIPEAHALFRRSVGYLEIHPPAAPA